MIHRPSQLSVFLTLLLSSSASSQHHDHPGPTTRPKSAPTNATFDQSVEGLPEVQATPIVSLNDKASYTLNVAPARQKIAGAWRRRLAYNGSIPGPLLKVSEGSTIHVSIRNGGPIATTLHPHGLRVDDRNDGVPGVGAPAIEPGRSHTATLRMVDPGMYWYHPHVREDFAQDAGLYGNIWVVPRDEAQQNPVHRELALILDDLSTEGNTAYYQDRATHTLMGRYGDVMLINGLDQFELSARSGEVIRFYLTNVANTRTFAFAIPGMRLKLVGTGNGPFAREEWVDRVTISPSERYVVEVEMPRPGSFVFANDKPKGRITMGKLTVTAEKAEALAQKFSELRTHPLSRELSAVKAAIKSPVRHTMRLSLRMDHRRLPMHHHGHGTPKAPQKIEWDDDMPAMNAQSDSQNVTWQIIDDQTKKENMEIAWQFKRGELVKIRIINDARSMHPMQHPIHFHGQRFAVVAVDGQEVQNLVWRDTLLVHAGEVADIILEASNPGQWMGHCHIAEHLSAGMMFGFSVSE